MMASIANRFAGLVAAADEEHIDRTHHWLWPEGYELLFGTIASVLIIGLLAWKAGPPIRRGLRARTERIQGDLDEAAATMAAADAEAAEIRRAKGDIESERARLLAEADAQAEAVLADGRARLDAEVAELEAKADADIASSGNRLGDELRAEIARLSAAAADGVVQRSLDDAARHRLIEDFISNLGATGSVV